ncbi:hypothetical protein FA95DRAFT_1601851 [Auriscalpium vulgare]|uniref:Uncharacterized protein n=1 Tax=Auriscalpium vulgare TaxID=40419 RepID=A0ACB8S8P4_9AGAM|nr:hypothetical protein FA95DRAFT_1601851 [Auriscalpium vulgare]
MPLSFLECMGLHSSTTLSRSSTPTAESSKVIAFRQKRTPAVATLPDCTSFDWIITLAELACDISNVLQSTPAAAAAALLMAILKAVAAVKVGQERCMRITKRATQALSQLGAQMEGKWDSAPQSLLDNIYALESTLSEIQDSMCRISQANWRKRLLSRAQIDDMLQQCEVGLHDALQGFQFTSLIQIHYAVGTQCHDGCVFNGGHAIATPSAGVRSLAPSQSMNTSNEFDDFLATLREAEDVLGFRRYHPSEVILSKVHVWQGGWFSELSDANLNGRKVVVKGYTFIREDALKQWYQDVKRLRNL